MIIKNILWLSCLFIAARCTAQQYNRTALYNQIDTGRHVKDFTSDENLKYYQQQAAAFGQQHLPPDSVYAMMLSKAGVFLSRQNFYQEAIRYTAIALKINQSGSPLASPADAAKNLYNIGRYYKVLNNFQTAIRYYDAAIAAAIRYPKRREEAYKSYFDIYRIHRVQGNYEEMRTAALLGLSKAKGNDEVYTAGFNTAVADAEVELKKYVEATVYLARAYTWYSRQQDTVNMFLCRQTEANIAMGQGNITKAYALLKEAVDGFGKRAELKDVSAALMYMALLFRDHLNDYNKAHLFLQETITLYKNQNQADYNCVSAYNNEGQTYFLQKNWVQALSWFQQAFKRLCGEYAVDDLFQNPPMKQLTTLPNAELTFFTLHNKAELLMLLYRQNHQENYITASKKSFVLADSVLTGMRNNQSGEESRIYWRQKSRNFFQQALEMCYLAHDSVLAFEFMEKSRAVLLNDHLNEIDAANFLSEAERAQEQTMKMEVVEKQLQLQPLSITDAGYEKALQNLLSAQDNLVHYLHLLEARHPAYYQYKYAEAVPTVSALQQYLQKNQQQWVQYFVSDTLLFVLYANGKQLKLYRQPVKNMEQLLPAFVSKCADQAMQNRHYTDFLQLSAHLYDTLLGKLPLQPGRLVVSPDNAIIPFDALCSNSKTGRMMVEDFAISYTYSARFLLKPLQKYGEASGDFLGMAPVSFPAFMKLVELPESKPALQSLEQYYPAAKLLTESDADSRSFLSLVSKYKVVNLYTHARGDNDNASEPVLFFSDSMVRLLELQKIQQPATQLIVLSACQTNTGRLASGEGVYSMARGFAMAGIPAAVATLWKADEEATYFITEQFHKNLSAGMQKDLALQKAKMEWLHQKGKLQKLPVYWANLTLTGNTGSIQLQKSNGNHYWLIAGCGLAAIGVLGCSIWFFRNRRNRHAS